MGFRDGFFWGTATSAYQIEGAAFEDGKGASIWDDYCRTEGKIFQGHTGDIACDHYHRYKDDVKLMAQLGIRAYRFSVSWPRVLPEGTGAVNEKGLDFYDQLVDELLSYNITPFVTLFHWDYPSALFRKGGWLNPDSPLWFAQYTQEVVKRLGDRVKYFITLNEPQCFIGSGFCGGEYGLAPGWKLPALYVAPMAHHVMLAHGLAVRAIREQCPGAKAGYAPCASVCCPATNAAEDIEAARAAYFAADEYWMYSVAWWSDPVVLGRYPADGLQKLERYLPASWRDDLKTICQPLDFYGQNIYFGDTYRRGREGMPEKLGSPAGYAQTAFHWPVIPETLYWGPKFLYERYKLPVVITENGLSCTDAVSLDGAVRDPNRIDFLNRYLLSYRKAADDGVDLLGYFLWSFMDNFEWARGYAERFGIVHVDFQTQKRTPKESAFWYKAMIESNGRSL